MTALSYRQFDFLCGAFALTLLVASMGCGTTKTYTATEQLLMSDAVDATIAKMNFTVLAERKVYLDTKFVNKPSFSGQSLIVDANYMLSALRQQMVADGVLLVDELGEAEIVAEPRIGALGIDAHDLIYGVPASNTISTVGTAVTGNSLIPPIPEIAFARREDKLGAAKLAVFAYVRTTREPFWQSGIAQSNSNSKATWVFGVGPFQQGTIYGGTHFAGEEVFTAGKSKSPLEQLAIEQYASSQIFYHADEANEPPTVSGSPPTTDSVVSAGHEEGNPEHAGAVEHDD